MQLGKHIVIVSIVMSSILAGACLKKNTGSNVDAGPGLGLGATCQTSADCRARLTCDTTTKTCVANANVIQGGACVLSAECIAGNYCTQAGQCAPSGKVPAGGVCSSEGDCASGLQCAQAGLTGICQQSGPGDQGRGCTQTSDCMAGLLCVSGTCGKAAASPWAGLVCPAPVAAARVYFHVPRASDPATGSDFYQLPFPNDIRIKNGKVSLDGHPRPGARILPFDLVDRYIGAIEAEASGFGANEAVYFRFSKEFNLGSLPLGCGANLIDITPGSPTYGLSPGTSCGAQTASSTYVCGPYLWVRPPVGHPLRPGTTYAAIMINGVTDLAGAAFGPDDDFTVMLGPALPTDPDLAAAYAAYKPLRDYLAAVPTFKDTDPFARLTTAGLVAAAVFTVQKYEDPLAAIDNAVAGLPAPAIQGMVHCGDPGVVSPCDDGLVGSAHVRGCLPEDVAGPGFDTYQGTIGLPIFQQGTPPYLTPADGGGIEYQAASDGGSVVSDAVDGSAALDGGTTAVGPELVALVQRTEKVCFSLTVPKGLPPASGWPLLVYAHGTGGSYRSAVDLGLAQDFAGGAAPAGLGSTLGDATPVPMAVLGYDGIMHGTRAAGSTKPVGELVYNFLNPPAARDNALQAAADLLAIPRAVAGFAALGVPIDQSRLALYGHSQGGNAASLVAARESRYRTIVMTGTGGTLIYTLLEKTQPVNVPAVLPFVLGEAGPPDSGLAQGHPALLDHPVLNLMQMYFERSDSVNFGRRLFSEPLADMTPHHILHVYGTGDSYSAVDTQKAYALSANFAVAGTMVDNFGLRVTAAPAWNNEIFGGTAFLTAAQVQYQPDGTYDGHFVSTQNPAARAAIQEMLVTTFRDGIPTVRP